MDIRNVGHAILSSDMSTEAKVATLVSMSRSKNGRRYREGETREKMLMVLLSADHPMRMSEIREQLGLDAWHAPHMAQQMQLIVRHTGVVRAEKVDTGKTIVIMVKQWNSELRKYVEVPKEVPERYNVYSLNI